MRSPRFEPGQPKIRNSGGTLLNPKPLNPRFEPRVWVNCNRVCKSESKKKWQQVKIQVDLTPTCNKQGEKEGALRKCKNVGDVRVIYDE